MYSKHIGISVLTNGRRLKSLQSCIENLLTHCYYRPLIIGILDNGSTDDTWSWLSSWVFSPENPWNYGVLFRIKHFQSDHGCAAGTNAACDMVRDCEFAIHIESDFELMPPEESGEDRLWLRRAVEFMQSVNGNYLYLRRITGDIEMMNHWWAQWMTKIVEKNGPYLSCPDFKWSNNPALRRTKKMYDNGTLPLDVRMDGPKGTSGWSHPELATNIPRRAWIHKWGFFVHERENQGDIFGKKTCSVLDGAACKYGFFKDGSAGDLFCSECSGKKNGFEDMLEHQKRFFKIMIEKSATKKTGIV